MDKKSMLDAMIAHYTGGNKAKFATLLGVSAQTISAWGVRKTFDTELIYTKCRDISSEWLLTGEGSMLRTDGVPALQATSSSNVPAESVVYSDAVTLRLMDKLDEKDALLKEKEYKIDQLQSELRQQSAELAALKAQHSQHQDKEAHPSAIGAITEAFTSESSGDYGEGFLLTKKPTTSKKSSAGKI